MKCEHGKTYKMGCNTCRCGYKNNLLCTKEVCVDQDKAKIKEEVAKPEVAKANDSVSKDNKDKIVIKKKIVRRIIRRKNKRYDTNTGTKGLPFLAPGKICVPGRIYQENCKRCYCKANKTLACANEKTCNQTNGTRELQPNDVRPPIKDSEFISLPELAHAAAPCAPGTTYRVDCNVCVCDEFQNLMCDKLLCINFHDLHQEEALKKTGMPCNMDDFTENAVIQSKCVQCTCDKGRTQCFAKDNCITDAESMRRPVRSRRTFDLREQQCEPNQVYNDNCNKCYCQEDQSLRCTQKKCLNYKEAVELQKQQAYLLRHGL